jgi:hypothetical protein
MTESVVIRWQLRDSLVGYMLRDPGFEVVATGGASFDPAAGVTLPAQRQSSGEVRASGSVVLRAHDGALTVPLVGVRIHEQTLWIAAPGDGEEAPEQAFVTLSGQQEAGVFQTQLAAESDALFLYNYVPGADFGRLEVRVVAE